MGLSKVIGLGTHPDTGSRCRDPDIFVPSRLRATIAAGQTEFRMPHALITGGGVITIYAGFGDLARGHLPLADNRFGTP